MKSAAHRVALGSQIVLLTLVIAAGVVWVVLLGRAPLQAADLEIAAQSLHSFAAEGTILSEQALAGNLFHTYLAKEAELVRDKIDDVQTALGRRAPVDDLREAWVQERAAARRLDGEFAALSAAAGEPARIRTAGERLRASSLHLEDLAQRMKR